MAWQFKSLFINPAKNILLLVTVIVLFLLGFIFMYNKTGLTGSFVELSIYRNGFLEVFILSLLGTLFVVLTSMFVGSSKILSFLGTNSLVLMCVHFPLAESLNVVLSKFELYNNCYGKILLASFEYLIVIGVSCLIVLFCKRYIPRLTGYSSFFNKY